MKTLLILIFICFMCSWVSAQNVCVQQGILIFEKHGKNFLANINIQKTPEYRGIYFVQLSLDQTVHNAELFNAFKDSLFYVHRSDYSSMPPRKFPSVLSSHIYFLILNRMPKAGGEIRIAVRSSFLDNLPEVSYALYCDTSFFYQPFSGLSVSDDIELLSEFDAQEIVKPELIHLYASSVSVYDLVFKNFQHHHIAAADDNSLRLIFENRPLDMNGERLIKSWENPFIKAQLVMNNADSTIIHLNVLHKRARVKPDHKGNRLAIHTEFMVPLLRVSGSFGSSGYGLHQFKHPFGIAVEGNRVYVVDSDNYCIKQMDMRGNVLGQIGSHVDVGGDLVKPIDIAAVNGLLYVSDRVMNRIIVYRPTGERIRIFGENRVQSPTYLQQYKNRLYVAEEGGGIKIIDFQDGSIVRTLPVSIEPDYGGFTIYQDKIYVCKRVGIDIYSLEGRRINSLSLRMPLSVAVLDGYLIVSLQDNGLVVYDPASRRAASLSVIQGERLESVRKLTLAGQTLWFSDYYNCMVHKVDISW